MFSQTATTDLGVSSEISLRRGHWRVPVQPLAGVAALGAVLVLALLLLSWGSSATQWAVLSTNNNLADAVANGVFDSAKTYVYSIPQRQEQDVIVGLTFLPLIRDDGGITYGANYSLYNGLAKPISNSTTTEEYYASFTFTYPNGSAVNVWFSGPQGNLTNDCGAAVVCQYLPTQQGSSRSPHSNYFQVTAAGNYTIHIVSVCPPGITCTSSIATLSVTRALSLVTYYRPYYISGMETTIVAEVTIAIVVALAILFLGIAGYRISRRKRAQSSHVRTPTSPVVD